MKKMFPMIMIFCLSISLTYASSISGTYAWDSLLSKIINDLSSNVAIAIGIISIIICGMIMAFTDLQAGGKRLLQVLLGLSIIFGASTLLSSLFSKGAII